MKLSDLQDVRGLSVKRKALKAIINAARDGKDISLSIAWPDHAELVISAETPAGLGSLEGLALALRGELEDVEDRLRALGVEVDVAADDETAAADGEAETEEVA